MPAPAPRPLLVHVDVSDTLSSGWRAGIQRVVVQLVDHLRRVDGLEVVPVAWSRDLQGHRRLRPDELDDLLGPATAARRRPGAAPTPTGLRAVAATAVAQVRRALRFALRVAVLVLVVARVKDPVRDALRWLSLRTVHRDHRELAVGELPAGSVLLELDTVWNQTWVDRDRLYRHLRDRGVHVAVLVYDLLPLEHPEWFERSLVEVFDTTLTLQARHAELVMAISEATAASFVDWSRRRGLEPPEPVVIPLGADATSPRTARPVALPPGVLPGRYVLVVGTVEPRKNHAVLIDAFERLAERAPGVQLVVVGRAGWENDAVVRRLETHPLAGTRLHWFRDADDALLSRLYDEALVVAVPSATEGFGLPVIEAFLHGIPVVASDRGALPEAGGGLAEYVAPDDVAGWVDALARHVEDPRHNRARRDALRAYRPPTWSDAAHRVASVLRAEFAAPRGTPKTASGGGGTGEVFS